MTNYKKTVALDFDGVIHSYTSKWQGASIIPDPPVEGAHEAIKELRKRFKVVILSTRANDPDGYVAMQRWLSEHGIEVDGIAGEGKPKAILYVDDRGFRFDGNWGSVLKALENGSDGVEPWNRQNVKQEQVRNDRTKTTLLEKTV